MPRNRLFDVLSACLFQVPSRVGEQGDVTGLFFGCRYNALVFCARGGLTAWADLAIFCNVLSEKIGFFIVNCQCLVCAKLTEFWLRKEAALASFTTAFAALLPFAICVSIFSHFYYSIFYQQARA
jgi:hypothetical protein